jgi:predicted enzyme related to lactoylglutathione lyase
LIADDVGDCASFYNEALNCEGAGEKERYLLLAEEGEPQAGLVTTPFEETASTWIPFVRVTDPDALAQQAVELGGRIVLVPGEDIRSSSVTLILDPAGAPLALQKWPHESGQEEKP